MMKRRKRAATVEGRPLRARPALQSVQLRNEQTAADSLNALASARSKYKERGDAASCGDWLALELKEHCNSQDGFDIGKFERVLKENDIEWNIDRETHGWIGRFRMNGRQKLAAVARKTGCILVSGEKVRAPGAKKSGRKPKTVDGELRPPIKN